MNRSIEKQRKRIFEIIEVGSSFDFLSRGYDLLNTIAILLNLAAGILYTFEDIRTPYSGVLILIEQVTVVFFCIDYILRIWTAKYLYKNLSQPRAIRKYVLSFTGIIDLLSFLPYYLPVFFPAGAVAFRLLRIVRIFRLFRINAYYDSLNVITQVIVSKKQQLISSVFIISVLMISSSLCMYSLEHNAQPEVFSNAFSGIWWATSTLLTVGYGDIYPITALGRLFAIIISFLGVGMVAIPTGIISAGFVDQYSRIKRLNEYGQEEEIHFIRIHLHKRDPWVGQTVSELHLPAGVILAVVHRNGKALIPKQDLILQNDDILIVGAESVQSEERITLKEITLKNNHPWIDRMVGELDISRHSIVVLIKRRKKALIPTDDFILHEYDTVILYTQTRMDAVITEFSKIEV